MAEITSSIELRAVTSQLDRKLKKVSTDLKGIGVQAQKTGGAMTKMTKKVGGGFDKLNKKLKENRASIAALGIAIGGIALKGVADFKKFEDGMKQIGTLGVKSLGSVEKQLDAVRRKFGVSGAEATKGFYDIVSAGASTTAIAMERLEAATKLAKAGNTDLAGAIDILTGGLNVFKRDAITSTEITDKLFLAVKFGKTTVEELGQTFGMVAPMVKAAGGTFDDFAASMATLTAGGLQTKQATTGLKGIMVGITKTTPKQAAEVKRLGIDFGVAAVEAQGLEGMLVNLKKAIDKDTTGDAQITMLNRLIDNSEAAAALDVMLSNMDNFSKISKEMKTAAGTTAAALDVVKASASFNFDVFNQSMSIMSKNIGAAVVPGLIDMANTLGPVVDFLASFIAMNPGIVKITIAMTALGVSLAFLGGPLTLAIAGVGTALVLVMKHFKAFEKGGVVALELVTLRWNNFWAGFDDMSIGQVFKKMFDHSIGWIKSMMTKIQAEMSGLFDWLAAPFEKATAAIERAFWWLMDKVVGNSWFPDLIQGIKDEIVGIGHWLVAPFIDATSAISALFKDLMENESFNSFVTGIKDALTDIGVWLVTPFKNASMSIRGYFKEMGVKDMTPGEVMKTVWTDLGEAIATNWDKATVALKEYWKAASGMVDIGNLTDDAGNISGGGNPHADHNSNLLRTIANLGVANTLLTGSVAATKLWKDAMGSLATESGLASESLTPINTKLAKLVKFDFGTTKRSLQKLTQGIRETQAAISDDIGGKANSTDAKSTARAMENATKSERAIRKARIAALRTAGVEILKVQLAQQEALRAKLQAKLDPKGTGKVFQRGFVSRMFFGEFTAITWEQKINALISRLGNGFDKMGAKILKFSNAIENLRGSSTTATSDARIRLAETKVAVAKTNVKADFQPMQNKSQLKASILKAGGEGELKAARSAKLAAELVKAEAELLKAQATATKTATTISTFFKAFNGSMTAIGKALGVFGTIGANITTQGAKMVGQTATMMSGIANSGAMAKTTAVVGKGLNFAKIPQMAKVLGVLARKVLIPLFAVYDAFKGFTELENLQANIPGAEDQTEFSTAEKSMSAVSEALGNFLNGFLDILGMITTHFGGDFMGEYLSNIDLAPEVGKILTILGNAFKTIRNVFKGIVGLFGGVDEDGLPTESAFTTALRTAGAVISKLLDILVDVSEFLAFITDADTSWSDEIGKGIDSLASWGADLFRDVMESIKNAVLSLVSKIPGMGWLAPEGEPASSSNGNNLTQNLRKQDEQKFAQSAHVKVIQDEYKEMGELSEKTLEQAEKFAQSIIKLEEIITKQVNDLESNKKGSSSSHFIAAGQTPRFATGGHVTGPGSGTSDDIPAMLSNGEYVINAKQTAKNRALLEHLNRGGNLSKFSNGGAADGSAYQFLQFQKQNSPHADTQGGKGSFDLDRTMSMFVNHLDQANPQVLEVIEMMNELERGSTNLNESKTLEHQYTQRINRSLLALNTETKDLALVTDDATGSVKELDLVVTDAINEWAGVGTSLTQPIKDAFLNGGSIADGIKMGLHNMFKNVAGKFLDRAFAPMENAIDGLFQNIGNAVTNSVSSTGGAGGGMGGIMDFIGGLFNEGGMVPQYLATGGVATANGPKGSDTVPAWLTPGEVVLNAGQQKNVANAMNNKGGGSTYVTNNINVSGNVDQRSIDQIRNVIASSPNEVNNASNTGKRNSSGIRRTR